MKLETFSIGAIPAVLYEAPSQLGLSHTHFMRRTGFPHPKRDGRQIYGVSSRETDRSGAGGTLVPYT